MKRVLVSGASGFLGSNFCLYFKQIIDIYGIYNHTPISVAGIHPIKADITRESDMQQRLDDAKPDAVIHLAAFSNPNDCQTHPDISEKINIEASETLAGLCAGSKIPFLFASTDLVFDGRNAPYAETDIPAPVNIYGLHKSIAEQSVLDIYPEATICRLPLMYGNSYTANKSFLQPLLENLAAGAQVKLFTDEYRSAASARDVCNGLMLCLEKPGEIYHLGGDERISRFAFGEKVCQVYGFDKNLLVKARQKDIAMPAPRPKDVSLLNDKAKKAGWEPGNIENELEYIKLQTPEAR